MAASADWWVDITNDRVDQIKSQLAMGEDPNAVSKEGQPSIMQAIQDGAWDVYDLLVRHRNINVNAVNAHDETPLMYLAVVGQTKRAAALIKKGAEVNRLGWTPLHYAASKGHADTVKLLLANKAMVNAPSPDGTSPLMMAAYAGSEEVVRILLNAGADVTARNLRGEDAAVWARRKHEARLAAQLDELTQKTLKQRGVASRGGAAAASASASQPSGRVQPNDAAKAPLPSGGQGGNRQQGNAQAAGSAQEDSGSTSRYFDLDRFERDDDRF
ncbi:ankyrin repeat domain-containing protein [Pusillimonas noertemannii]|nr:ankyrin repeat domain-containing protein [Pusillimonas noertemannii]